MEHTEEQLIDYARQHGCEGINHWKLERWRNEDVIPRPVVEHLGYGMGTRSIYPAQTPDQILAVCRLLKSTRKFYVVRFQLWREGYLIPLPVLKETIRQLVPLLRWNVPRQEEQKYKAVERWLNTLLQRIRGPFYRFLFKRFGKNFENFQSFLEIQLNLLYGIRVAFDEPSHYEGELSATEIFAQGFGLEDLRFLSSDLPAELQSLSDQGLLSIKKMNTSLDMAAEEDLRRANSRTEVVALIFEWLELIGIVPKSLRSLLLDISHPSFQALLLVFLLQLEKNGYADNADRLLEVFRVYMPGMRAFRALFLALQQELPAVAKEFSSPEETWQRIKNLSEQEREQYFAQQTGHLRGVYLQNQAGLDAFWQRHPEIKNAFEDVDALSSGSDGAFSA